MRYGENKNNTDYIHCNKNLYLRGEPALGDRKLSGLRDFFHRKKIQWILFKLKKIFYKYFELHLVIFSRHLNNILWGCQRRPTAGLHRSWQFAYTLDVVILIWNERKWIFNIVWMISKNMNIKLAIRVGNFIF